VRRIGAKAPLKPYGNGRGYLQVSLSKNNVVKKQYIHRLVLGAFETSPQIGAEVNHTDGDKTNNSLENLEWTDRAGNVKHGYNCGLYPKGEDSHYAKLSAKDVLEIRELAGTFNQTDLASIYGVSSASICLIVNRKNWKHLSI